MQTNKEINVYYNYKSKNTVLYSHTFGVLLTYVSLFPRPDNKFGKLGKQGSLESKKVIKEVTIVDPV